MSSLELKRREGESLPSFLYRFNKRMQQSGVLREAKKRRFYARPANRLKRKRSALHRVRRIQERERAKKLGLL